MVRLGRKCAAARLGKDRFGRSGLIWQEVCRGSVETGSFGFGAIWQEVCKGTMGMRPLGAGKAAKVFSGAVRCGAARFGLERQEVCRGLKRLGGVRWDMAAGER